MAWWPRPSRSTSWRARSGAASSRLRLHRRSRLQPVRLVLRRDVRGTERKDRRPAAPAGRDARGDRRQSCRIPRVVFARTRWRSSPAIEYQLAHGFRADHRRTQPAGDGRQPPAGRRDCGRHLALGGHGARCSRPATSAQEVGIASNEVSREWTPLDEQALLAVYRAQLVHVWTANIIAGTESTLASGRVARSSRARAGDVLPRHHRVHPPHPGAR